eukprot:m.50747 g.50747  ORF g.50747 m.50747 type:complete len:98 (+) comp12570_c0_seq1:313-606(+)
MKRTGFVFSAFGPLLYVQKSMESTEKYSKSNKKRNHAAHNLDSKNQLDERFFMNGSRPCNQTVDNGEIGNNKLVFSLFDDTNKTQQLASSNAETPKE